MTTILSTRVRPWAGLACVTTIVACGVLGNGTALSQTASQQTAFRAQALAVHNLDRAKYPVPALALAAETDVLNTGAQDWAIHLAQTGKLEHSTSDQRNGAGENIFVEYDTGNISPDAVAKAMVDAWYGEVGNYDYTTPEAHTATTGHFTQVIWKGTTTLGCGYSIGTFTDNTQTPPVVFNTYFGVCRYTPAGNVSTQYTDNVPLATPNTNPM